MRSQTLGTSRTPYEKLSWIGVDTFGENPRSYEPSGTRVGNAVEEWLSKADTACYRFGDPRLVRKGENEVASSVNNESSQGPGARGLVAGGGPLAVDAGAEEAEGRQWGVHAVENDQVGRLVRRE